MNAPGSTRRSSTPVSSVSQPIALASPRSLICASWIATARRGATARTKSIASVSFFQPAWAGENRSSIGPSGTWSESPAADGRPGGRVAIDDGP